MFLPQTPVKNQSTTIPETMVSNTLRVRHAISAATRPAHNRGFANEIVSCWVNTKLGTTKAERTEAGTYCKICCSLGCTFASPKIQMKEKRIKKVPSPIVSRVSQRIEGLIRMQLPPLCKVPSCNASNCRHEKTHLVRKLMASNCQYTCTDSGNPRGSVSDGREEQCEEG